MIRYLLSGDIQTALIFFVSAVVTVFLILPFHEAAHSFVALKLGDTTQNYKGRLTLNPFAHIDWLGAGLIALFGFGWAKPVEVNPFYFKNRKWGMALTSLAGPVANLIAAFAALLVVNLLFVFISIPTGVLYYIAVFFNEVAVINIGLAVFNLIPLPPLDGSKILFALLPDRVYDWIMRYQQFLYIILIVLIFATDVLDGPISVLTGGIYGGLDWLASLPFIFIN